MEFLEDLTPLLSCQFNGRTRLLKKPEPPPNTHSTMTIALVVHDFDERFGQGRYCVELCRRLGGRYQVDVLANTFAAEPISGVRHVPIRAWRSRALATIFSFLFSVERYLRHKSYDLIHAQGLTCWSADVITAHICTAARLARAKAVGRELSARMILPWERRFYRQKRARHLIGVSRLVEGEIRQWYGWNKPGSVIYHGTNLERFRPVREAAEKARIREELGIRSLGWQWLFVGEAVKGLAEVIAQLPSFPDARLVAVSRSAPAAYLSQAASLGVSERFHFLGPRNDLERVYRCSDIFVYPSRYDTFGMVVTEAMASGIPVIVGRNIGAAEIIEDGSNGLLCDPDQPGTVTTALKTLTSNPEVSIRIGQKGRETVGQHGWDACAAATDRVYRQVNGEVS